MTSVIPTFTAQQGLVLDEEEEHALTHTRNSHTKTCQQLSKSHVFSSSQELVAPTVVL